MSNPSVYEEVVYKIGGNGEMTNKNMVLVDLDELKSVVADLNMSLGEEDPTELLIPALSKLEKNIEETTWYEGAAIVDVVALRGVAEILELVLKLQSPFILTTKTGAAVRGEEISREKLLQFHLECAIEDIYELAGDGEEKEKPATHGNE